MEIDAFLSLSCEPCAPDGDDVAVPILPWRLPLPWREQLHKWRPWRCGRCGCPRERDEYGDQECWCDACWRGCVPQHSGPTFRCPRCGCPRERDEYGDRECWCDACWHGCVPAPCYEQCCVPFGGGVPWIEPEEPPAESPYTAEQLAKIKARVAKRKAAAAAAAAADGSGEAAVGVAAAGSIPPINQGGGVPR
eukprot:gene9646-biopygen1256